MVCDPEISFDEMGENLSMAEEVANNGSWTGDERVTASGDGSPIINILHGVRCKGSTYNRITPKG